MSSPIPITIIGGGLAGLALGIALRRENISVTLHEAGYYPRHRVCGEFLSGVNRSTLNALGIEEALGSSAKNRSSGWYEPGRPPLTWQLPEAALGISRYTLDAAMADRFRSLGGELREGSRRRFSREAGVVRATGRERGEGDRWIGLKAHFTGLAPHQDLEMHLGAGAYVGLSRIENDKVNVCGLFLRRSGMRAAKEKMLHACVRSGGLDELASRIENAKLVPGSATAVASLDFKSWNHTSGIPRVGDACSAIPPFTGNGMSIALESAALCTGPLITYCNGTADWDQVCREINRRIRARFASRLRLARAIHPLLLRPATRRAIFCAGRLGLLPFTCLFNKLR